MTTTDSGCSPRASQSEGPKRRIHNTTAILLETQQLKGLMGVINVRQSGCPRIGLDAVDTGVEDHLGSTTEQILLGE